MFGHLVAFEITPWEGKPTCKDVQTDVIFLNGIIECCPPTSEVGCVPMWSGRSVLPPGVVAAAKKSQLSVQKLSVQNFHSRHPSLCLQGLQLTQD